MAAMSALLLTDLINDKNAATNDWEKINTVDTCMAF